MPILFILPLTLGIFLLGKELFDEDVGFIAAIAITLFPLQGLTGKMLDIPAVACLTWILYMYLKSERFTNKKYSNILTLTILFGYLLKSEVGIFGLLITIGHVIVSERSFSFLRRPGFRPIFPLILVIATYFYLRPGPIGVYTTTDPSLVSRWKSELPWYSQWGDYAFFPNMFLKVFGTMTSLLFFVSVSISLLNNRFGIITFYLVIVFLLMSNFNLKDDRVMMYLYPGIVLLTTGFLGKRFGWVLPILLILNPPVFIYHSFITKSNWIGSLQTIITNQKPERDPGYMELAEYIGANSKGNIVNYYTGTSGSLSCLEYYLLKLESEKFSFNIQNKLETTFRPGILCSIGNQTIEQKVLMENNHGTILQGFET